VGRGRGVPHPVDQKVAGDEIKSKSPAGGNSSLPALTPQAPLPTARPGGRRPGAGRPKKPPTPESDNLARFDVARHVDPKTQAPEWTAELVDRFVQAYFDGRLSLRKACQKTGVPYRAAVRHREENAPFADRLAMTEAIYDDVLLEEQQRRALEDPNRPASLIFELKSRHKQYKPASGNNTVKINIGFLDKTFGASAALDVGTDPPKALGTGDVVDAEIVQP
jgi:hypothetical protein